MKPERIIYVDGSGWSNNKNCAIAIICESATLKNKKKKYVEVFYEPMRIEEIEYVAIIRGLENCGNERIIFSDNKNVVREINGLKKVKPKNLKLYKQVKNILKERNKVSIKWISREENLAGKYLEQRLITLKKNSIMVSTPPHLRYLKKKAWKKRNYGRR